MDNRCNVGNNFNIQFETIPMCMLIPRGRPDLVPLLVCPSNNNLTQLGNNNQGRGYQDQIMNYPATFQPAMIRQHQFANGYNYQMPEQQMINQDGLVLHFRNYQGFRQPMMNFQYPSPPTTFNNRNMYQSNFSDHGCTPILNQPNVNPQSPYQPYGYFQESHLQNGNHNAQPQYYVGYQEFNQQNYHYNVQYQRNGLFQQPNFGIVQVSTHPSPNNTQFLQYDPLVTQPWSTQYPLVRKNDYPNHQRSRAGNAQRVPMCSNKEMRNSRQGEDAKLSIQTTTPTTATSVSTSRNIELSCCTTSDIMPLASINKASEMINKDICKDHTNQQLGNQAPECPSSESSSPHGNRLMTDSTEEQKGNAGSAMSEHHRAETREKNDSIRQANNKLNISLEIISENVPLSMTNNITQDKHKENIERSPFSNYEKDQIRANTRISHNVSKEESKKSHISSKTSQVADGSVNAPASIVTECELLVTTRFPTTPNGFAVNVGDTKTSSKSKLGISESRVTAKKQVFENNCEAAPEPDKSSQLTVSHHTVTNAGPSELDAAGPSHLSASENNKRESISKKLKLNATKASTKNITTKPAIPELVVKSRIKERTKNNSNTERAKKKHWKPPLNNVSLQTVSISCSNIKNNSDRVLSSEGGKNKKNRRKKKMTKKQNHLPIELDATDRASGITGTMSIKKVNELTTTISEIINRITDIEQIKNVFYSDTPIWGTNLKNGASEHISKGDKSFEKLKTIQNIVFCYMEKYQCERHRFFCLQNAGITRFTGIQRNIVNFWKNKINFTTNYYFQNDEVERFVKERYCQNQALNPDSKICLADIVSFFVNHKSDITSQDLGYLSSLHFADSTDRYLTVAEALYFKEITSCTEEPSLCIVKSYTLPDIATINTNLDDKYKMRFLCYIDVQMRLRMSRSFSSDFVPDIHPFAKTIHEAWKASVDMRIAWGQAETAEFFERGAEKIETQEMLGKSGELYAKCLRLLSKVTSSILDFDSFYLDSLAGPDCNSSPLLPLPQCELKYIEVVFGIPQLNNIV